MRKVSTSREPVTTPATRKPLHRTLDGETFLRVWLRAAQPIKKVSSSWVCRKGVAVVGVCTRLNSATTPATTKPLHRTLDGETLSRVWRRAAQRSQKVSSSWVCRKGVAVGVCTRLNSATTPATTKPLHRTLDGETFSRVWRSAAQRSQKVSSSWVCRKGVGVAGVHMRQQSGTTPAPTNPLHCTRDGETFYRSRRCAAQSTGNVSSSWVCRKGFVVAGVHTRHKRHPRRRNLSVIPTTVKRCRAKSKGFVVVGADRKLPKLLQLLENYLETNSEAETRDDET